MSRSTDDTTCSRQRVNNISGFNYTGICVVSPLQQLSKFSRRRHAKDDGFLLHVRATESSEESAQNEP